MNVVWKRPDGFHGATPEDFIAVPVGGHSNLWLHKEDHNDFPFRVSGGWEEEDASKRLNNIINLLGKDDAEWLSYLTNAFSHSLKDDSKEYMDETTTWLNELKGHLKGDSWEVDIMTSAFDSALQRLEQVAQKFLSK